MRVLIVLQVVIPLLKGGFSDIITTFIAMLILAISCIILAVTSSYTGNYQLIKSQSYKRTPKGEIVNKKIEGLKIYMKDYSLLDQREQEELVVWEEYLIYSVIFDLNSTSIIEDIYKLVDVKSK